MSKEPPVKVEMGWNWKGREGVSASVDTEWKLCDIRHPRTFCLRHRPGRITGYSVCFCSQERDYLSISRDETEDRVRKPANNCGTLSLPPSGIVDGGKSNKIRIVIETASSTKTDGNVRSVQASWILLGAKSGENFTAYPAFYQQLTQSREPPMPKILEGSLQEEQQEDGDIYHDSSDIPLVDLLEHLAGNKQERYTEGADGSLQASLVICGPGLGSKPGLGLGFSRLRLHEE
ncbi:hypothetical protein M422DRAFT_248176 [Sphaerobolus stellatus SS14]|uniref:Uncharacterized protein n=1 Tax=Sphaerobolus stellatus (strain SS14) TaxID=990650 RepID=A0A0C9W4W8_SPHS4|nr:hypothetical protein M422DRAFT_248176 [Sphaerobolus stellatus SS14]